MAHEKVTLILESELMPQSVMKPVVCSTVGKSTLAGHEVGPADAVALAIDEAALDCLRGALSNQPRMPQ